MSGKKVLVLTGSPRRGGNSDLMAAAFSEGAREAGHDVTIYETAHKNIKGCRACDRCFSTGKACVFDDDDYNSLADMLAEADVIAFSVPLYWYTFPTQVKAALDRTYAFFFSNTPLKSRQSVLMACAGEDNYTCFEGLVKSYQLMCDYLGLKTGDPLLVPGIYDVGAIKETDGLAKAKELGKNL